MVIFELTNKQREFFGLDPIPEYWNRILLKGDTYRPESVLYFDKDTIKRHIVSTNNKYFEKQYDELTRDGNILLPKTGKGKEKKLTASTLEQRMPLEIYLAIENQDLIIGNYSTQTTFYSREWEKGIETEQKSIPELVNEFVENSPEDHFTEINKYKKSKRQNVKFKAGDYFCFKLGRTTFGFGRVLLDVNKIRKKRLISDFHGLHLLMGMPVIVQLFAYKSETKNVSILVLENQPKLPSDVMMDNLLLYGEYEIIGYRELKEEEFDFPISYGKSIDQRRIVFLQWGLIHKELPKDKFCKHIEGETQHSHNPYGYYSIGFRPGYDTMEIINTIENNGIYDFEKSNHFMAKRDLRNPKNKEIRDEIFEQFGLDPEKNYIDNCKLTKTILTTEIIKKSNSG